MCSSRWNRTGTFRRAFPDASLAIWSRAAMNDFGGSLPQTPLDVLFSRRPYHVIRRLRQRVQWEPAAVCVIQDFEVVHQVVVAGNVAAGDDEVFAGRFLNRLEFFQLSERAVTEANRADLRTANFKLQSKPLAGPPVARHSVMKNGARQRFGSG